MIAEVAEYTTWLSRFLKFVKLQRPVVEGAGQAEAVVTREVLRALSPLYMARTWGKVTWLSSMKRTKSPRK